MHRRQEVELIPRNPGPSTGKYDDLNPRELEVFRNDLIEIFWTLGPFPDPTLMVRELYERRPRIDPELFSPLCTFAMELCWPEAPTEPYEKWYR